MVNFIERKEQFIILEATGEEENALKDILLMSGNDFTKARSAIHHLNEEMLTRAESNNPNEKISKFLDELREAKLKRIYKIGIDPPVEFYLSEMNLLKPGPLRDIVEKSMQPGQSSATFVKRGLNIKKVEWEDIDPEE